MRTWALVATLAVVASPVQADDAGFKPMFNGKDLTGWKVMGTTDPKAVEAWSVSPEGVSAQPGRGWLGTEKEYTDFVLRLEWRLPKENGNSGVFLRVPADGPPKQSPSQYAVEIQILDDEGSQFKGGKIKPYQYSGSIYGLVAAKPGAYKPGEWNRYEIVCRGGAIKVTYNGLLVAEGNETTVPELAKRPKKGHIGLQNHGSAVEFRNVQIKELAP